MSVIQIALETAIKHGDSEQVDALQSLLESSLKETPERQYRGLPVRTFDGELFAIDREMGRPIPIDPSKISDQYEGTWKVVHDALETEDLVEKSMRLIKETKAKLSSSKAARDALTHASSPAEPLKLRKNQCDEDVPLTLTGIYFLCETCEKMSSCLQKRKEWRIDASSSIVCPYHEVPLEEMGRSASCQGCWNNIAPYSPYCKLKKEPSQT